MLDYFDDPSRRPRKKRTTVRIYTQEELEGLRRAAEISRARWRAELEARDKTVYEAKRPRSRVRRKPKNEADERAKFAAAMARAELRRAYWSAAQDVQLKQALVRVKPASGKKPR